MGSLYTKLANQGARNFAKLQEREYYKSSLIGLSHAVEDVIINLNLTATMFVTFQRFEFFLEEVERYRELAEICHKIFIFCQGIDEQYLQDISEFDNVEFIELSHENPLVQEWHIVVSHPEYPMMFVAREVKPSKEDELTNNFDEFRTFQGFFDFAPDMVKIAEDFFCDEFGLNRTEKRKHEFLSYSLSEQSIEFLNNFINNSLLMLEDRNRRLIETTKEYIEFKTDMDNMEKVHSKFLPKDPPDIPGMDIAAYYLPANKVGSDFYQYITFKNKFIFYIADVTGHGFDGALINIFIRENIKNCLFSFENDFEITAESLMNKLAQVYAQEAFPDDQFACVLIGVLDLDEQVITLSNAGIEVPPYLCRYNGNYMEIPVSGIPLTNTVDKELLVYNQYTVHLQSGDLILICSDGINQGLQYAQSNTVQQSARINRFKNSNDIINQIVAELFSFDCPPNYNFKKDHIKDDLTLLAVKNSKKKDEA